MLRNVFIFSTLCILAACGGGEPDARKKIKDYRIVSFTIEYDSVLSDDGEFAPFKKELTKRLLNSLQNQTGTHDARMDIKVTDLSLKINAGRAFLVGDDYRIVTTVTLWDPMNFRTIAKEQIVFQTGESNILHAALGDPRASKEEHTENLYTGYINTLLETPLNEGSQP